MKRFLRPCSALLMALALHGLSAVEDPASASLPLRAALHEDATLEAPLTQLMEAWRQAQRLPELLALYRAHLGQYPQDSGATIVLLRLLQATRDPAAATAARQAVTDFPDSAYLRWLAFLALNDARDPAALDALAKAVELETVVWRRDQWTEWTFRRLYLCSVLVFSVIFNHQSESPTFVIAAAGAGIWFASLKRATRGEWALFVFFVVCTILASSDAMPRVIQRAVFDRYHFKTVPAIALWVVLQFRLWKPRGTVEV